MMEVENLTFSYGKDKQALQGMRQRVSMTRTLISNPRLLFPDEPTSGLDTAGAVLFRRIIEKERRKQ